MKGLRSKDMAPRVSVIRIAQYGEALCTREEAVPVAETICSQLRRGEVLLIGFGGVQVASISFLDELLVRLHVELLQSPECMLIAHGLNSTVREHVASIAVRRQIVLAVVSRSGVALLGGDPRLRRMLRAARDLDSEFTTAELIDKLPRARDVEQNVKTLVDNGVLCGYLNPAIPASAQKLRRPPTAGMLADLAD